MKNFIINGIVIANYLLLLVVIVSGQEENEHRDLYNVAGVRYMLPAIRCDANIVPSPDSTNGLACPKSSEIIMSVVGKVLNEMTYSKQWLAPTESSLYPDTIKGNTVLPLLGECQSTCDSDDDCAPGLLCSTVHTAELVSKGLNGAKANCANENVCFQKELVDGRRFLRGVEQGMEQDMEQDMEQGMEQDMEQGEERDGRLLSCGQCSPYCKLKPNAPACIVLNCDNCRRRRNLQWFSTRPAFDKSLLFQKATAKLRELSLWKNITDADPNCAAFLTTATCYEEI